MKSRVENFAALVRNPDALLLRLLHETRMLNQPIDFADLERRGVIRKEGAWYQVRNLADLPEHVAKRIEELLWDGENISVKFDSAAREYEELAELAERMARARGLLDSDVRASSSILSHPAPQSHHPEWRAVP